MPSEDWNVKFAKHWKNYPAPARPTPGELAVIEKHIVEKSSKKVLILGATPEYRLLCRKHNLKIVCVDYSESNFEIISNDANIEQVDSETFIEKDWLKMDFSEEFDLIVGDYVINVLRKESLAKFLDNLQNALKPKAALFLKTHVAGDKVDVEQELQNYYKNQNDKNIYSAIASPVMLHAMDENGIVDFKKGLDLLEELHQKNKIKHKDIAVFRKLCWESALLKLWFPNKDFLEKMLAERFNVKINRGEDWMCKMLPLYRLEK